MRACCVADVCVDGLAPIASDKKLRKLQKKLRQVQVLYQKQKGGQTLSSEEAQKLSTREHLMTQVASLQKQTN